jgi:hypothetical protein
LVLFGASGSGKSALLAQVLQETREKHPATQVISRFIGATPSSTNPRAFLDGLCRQLSMNYGADESKVPTDYRELREEFPKYLALATKARPLPVFVDALDQLPAGNAAADLAWIPAKLPAPTRLVVSTTPGPFLAMLDRDLPACRRRTARPIIGILSTQAATDSGT